MAVAFYTIVLWRNIMFTIALNSPYCTDRSESWNVSKLLESSFEVYGPSKVVGRRYQYSCGGVESHLWWSWYGVHQLAHSQRHKRRCFLVVCFYWCFQFLYYCVRSSWSFLFIFS